jgi:hypothetical protein
MSIEKTMANGMSFSFQQSTKYNAGLRIEFSKVLSADLT